MSEVPDGSGPVQRRPPRVSDGGSPVNGALAIVLAVVAVVAGFLILRSISDDGNDQLGIPTDSGAASGDQAPSSTTTPADSSATTPPVTTAPPLVTTGATVVVANANGVSGSAASMSSALEAGPHFTMGPPVDASDETGVLTVSVVYWNAANPAAEAVANSVAQSLGGGVTVLPMPGTPPTKTGTFEGDVLLMLGTDKANKTLEELNAGATGATAVITNPPLTGSTTPAG